jgi:UDP-glucuronate decarboxylase
MSTPERVSAPPPPFASPSDCCEATCARDRIFQTARNLFYRHGIRGVSVDAIAAEAGTTKVTLYRVFSSKDDLVVALARFGIVASVGRYETTFKQRTGARRYPFWRLTVTKVAPWSPLEWDTGVEQALQSRRTGDLVWAAVKKVKEIEPTALVYDFSVPGLENFWAGTGVAAHNTYGPLMRVDDGRAVPAFFKAALRNEPLPVFGDGSQTRSLCYVDDEVEGLLRLLVSDYTGPVNIGNPYEVTILELAAAVQDAVGAHPGIVHHPAPVDDPRVRCPDTALAERVLGWKAETPLTDGLARTVHWFREQLGS